MWVFHAYDEHVLGHPAFVAGHVRGDAQGKTFLSEQRIAAVAGTVGPDFTRLWEMNDVFLLVAGPRNIFLPGLQRRSNAVQAGDNALVILINLFKDGKPDASHDAHADDNIGGVGELYANLRQGRRNRAHAERQDVHGAPVH